VVSCEGCLSLGRIDALPKTMYAPYAKTAAPAAAIKRVEVFNLDLPPCRPAVTIHRRNIC